VRFLGQPVALQLDIQSIGENLRETHQKLARGICLSFDDQRLIGPPGPPVSAISPLEFLGQRVGADMRPVPWLCFQIGRA